MPETSRYGFLGLEAGEVVVVVVVVAGLVAGFSVVVVVDEVAPFMSSLVVVVLSRELDCTGSLYVSAIAGNFPRAWDIA